MSTLLSRMFRDRCASCQVGQGRSCRCEGAALCDHGERCPPLKAKRVHEPTPGSFWWAYAALLVSVAALWRAFA